MPDKTARKAHGGFAFRLKMSDYEVEINGSYDNVLNTLKDLPTLIDNIERGFEKVKPKKVATLTVRTGAPSSQKTASQQYPQISPTQKVDEAILKLLETDWGKWRPRTIEELGEALKASEMEPSPRTLAGVLMDLVKKEKVRRWNTSAGYVYILAEKEALHSRGKLNEQD